MEGFLISMALGIVHTALKSGGAAPHLEKTLLALRDAINMLYPGQ